MKGVDWLVVAAGAAGIAWVIWYFFVASRSAATGGRRGPSVSGADQPETTIVVRGGYDPATIRVRAGEPVRLVFDRRETSSCSEEVVFPDFGLRRFLPANQRTTIVVTPPAPGTYAFTCGMSMLHGRLVAE